MLFSERSLGDLDDRIQHPLRLLYENPAYMTVLPLYTVKKSIHEKSLAAVRVEDCKMSQFRQVIYHKNKVLTPQIQGMLDTIVEVAKRPF